MVTFGSVSRALIFNAVVAWLRRLETSALLGVGVEGFCAFWQAIAMSENKEDIDNKLKEFEDKFKK